MLDRWAGVESKKEMQYTIEYNGSKGWEVSAEFDSGFTAINEFESCIMRDATVDWRLTARKHT